MTERAVTFARSLPSASTSVRTVRATLAAGASVWLDAVALSAAPERMDVRCLWPILSAAASITMKANRAISVPRLSQARVAPQNGHVELAMANQVVLGDAAVGATGRRLGKMIMSENDALFPTLVAVL
jgi:hypothetical protein